MSYMLDLVAVSQSNIILYTIDLGKNRITTSGITEQKWLYFRKRQDISISFDTYFGYSYCPILCAFCEMVFCLAGTMVFMRNISKKNKKAKCLVRLVKD